MLKIEDCVQLAGSPTAGILLFRMQHWDKLPKVYHDGHFWMVNSNRSGRR